MTEGSNNGTEAESPARVEIEADPTISYAHVQNNVPVVRALQITNQSELPLLAVEVLIACDPEFAQPRKLYFERLEPKESRRIAPVDLQPSHGYLAQLTEAEKARVAVTIKAEGKVVGAADHPIEVLAYDQWAGTRALPELLAAFCTPNAPAVDRVLAAASELLQARGAVMDGYQSKNRESVWTQVSAIYSALAALNLQYSDPPASFGRDGQKIRSPERIKTGGIATCLDLAMLAASCVEQAGLNPVVLFQEGHAWVGCWLLQTQFSIATTEDAQAVRKRVDSGELLVFEATGLAQASRPSLRAMHERGTAHLREEGKFRFAIDIKRARELRILPLPSREEAANQQERAVASAPAIESAPSLPPLDPSVLPATAVEIPENETPAGRLGRWKSRLLDMTLRNRMLNFRPTKQNMRLLVPDPAHLEDALADGREFRIRPIPRVMEGTDPRSAEVHVQRGGGRPPEEMAREALGNGELLAMVEKEEIDARLLAVHNAGRDSLEEGGANTLFLALGFLEWREAEKAEAAHRAPLILVPVSMHRQSVHGGFKLRRHDDETIINPTLRQFLRDQFRINVPALENPPADESGLDVSAIWQAVRLGINHIKGWEVVSEVYLGTFSFAKFLMWKDLQDRADQLKQSKVVAHLIDHAGKTFGSAEDGSGEERPLDESHRPQDILAPLLSDSSQLRMIALATQGRDLVCEGPPGTGKSQSITNLIANLVANDKTVLFVSEKMAALDVVQRRLKSIGLGPFCLEIHSSKASKGEVVKQLNEALQSASRRSVRDWEREAERLAVLRQELNGFVDLIHREHRSGWSVFDATGVAVEHRQRTPAALPWTSPEEHDRDALDALRDLIRRISVLAREIGALKDHRLASIGRSDWSPSFEEELYRRCDELRQTADHLEAAGRAVAESLKVPETGQSLQGYAALVGLAEVLTNAPNVPSAFAARAHEPQLRSRVVTMATHGVRRRDIWTGFGNQYSEALGGLNGAQLTQEWTAAKLSWWPKSWFATRAIAKRLATLRIGGERPLQQEIDEMLPALVRLNEEDKTLASFNSESQLLELPPVQAVDWASVESSRVWAESLAKSVAAVGQGDLEATIALQQRIVPLVGEHRAMLSPNGGIGARLLALREAFLKFEASLKTVQQLAQVRRPIAGESSGALTNIRTTLQSWAAGRPQLRTWCVWSGLRDESLRRGLQGLVEAAEAGSVTLPDLPMYFEYSYACWFLQKKMDREPLLCRFTGVDHERKIREFREADERFQSLTREYVVAKLCSRVPSGAVPTGPDSELGTLRREVQRQRGHMPLRRLVQSLPSLLPKLKPCLLMSPLSVAQYLTAGTALFDCVIFDEASQIPVWDAIGAIARGKQVIVVGDSRQLPPTSFFNRGEASQQADEEGEVQDLESILDELKSSGLRAVDLQWHYRSKHEGLIAFSNQQYYENRLITFPSPVTEDRAVEWRPVSGTYDRGGSKTNRAEAEAIVQEITKHFLAKHTCAKTVGVVTFNLPQRDLIESLLEARRRENLELDRRMAEHKLEPPFIKNLESVQGDERDVIMFSVTYGPDITGRITNNFGPLNLEGGHRRLNVAVTRAREAVLLFSTLRPEAINAATVRARGVMDLKLYLEYAQRGPRALAAASTFTGRPEESPFERAVAAALRAKGWEVHPQVGVSSYRIDLGVVHPKMPGRYVLGIEADGRTYHSAASARDRDRLRQLVLEGLGWRIHRIWSTDWYLNHDRELERVLTLLDELLAQPEQSVEKVDEPESLQVAPVDVPDAQIAMVDHPPAAQSLPVFRPASLAEEALPVAFGPEHLAKISRQMEEVVAQEGPIKEAVLFRRIAQAAEWGRIGSRIEAQLRRLATMRFTKVVDLQGAFYIAKSIVPAEWKEFRVASDDPNSRRNVQDVSILELANLIQYLLEHGGTTTLQGISKDVGRLVGMLRITSDAEERVKEALEHLTAKGVVRVDGSTVSLAQ